MAKGGIRRMFPGGNTSQGFYSFYDNIIPRKEAARLFILKGGPGVGKSTIIKQIANEMVERGYDVELMHCSSDSDSLDGVVIPAIRVAIIDGTAPHTVDPKYPGAVDEIINLGEFWDEEGIRSNRNEIMELAEMKSKFFERAYRYLRAAAEVYSDCEAIYNEALDEGRLNSATWEIIVDIFGKTPIPIRAGRQRHLFASAITPKGNISFLETVLTGKIYKLSADVGAGTDRILEKVHNAAVERGFSVECFHCALNPRRIDHLVIPELNVSITASNKFHDARLPVYREIDFGELLDDKNVKKYGEALRFNENVLDGLLNAAISSLNQAKSLHGRIENFYTPHMNFESIQRCSNSIRERIIKFAREITET